MKHADFHMGLEFLGSGGFRWRCTDVGTRTIVAIRLDHDSIAWYQGPPYIAKETVFDEHEIAHCHLTMDDAIRAAITEKAASHHPGFPHEVITRLTRTPYNTPRPRYPHAGVLRFDRRRNDGEILHPYAARREGETWIVQLYLLFPQTWAEIAEADFIELPMATDVDMQARASARE